MKRQEVAAYLRRRGCEFDREGTRHTRYINLATGDFSYPPRHQEVPNRLVRVICRQPGSPHPWE